MPNGQTWLLRIQLAAHRISYQPEPLLFGVIRSCDLIRWDVGEPQLLGI